MEGLNADASAEPRLLPPTPAEEAVAVLRRDGAVVVEGVWPRAAIERLRTALLAAHPGIFDGSVVADRKSTGRGRYHAPATVSAEVLDSGLFDAPILEGLLREILGGEYEIESFGLMMAQPGAEEQGVHRDGGELFPGTGLDRLLPAAALTVAIPLVDVGPHNSRTAVIPGSHRHVDTPFDGERFAPDLPLGSVFVWDYRTLHYGTAHRSAEPRPVIYLVPCRPYWSDHKNFRGGKRRLVVRGDIAARLDARFVRAEKVA